jgi:hypothetical protein
MQRVKAIKCRAVTELAVTGSVAIVETLGNVHCQLLILRKADTHY